MPFGKNGSGLRLSADLSPDIALDDQRIQARQRIADLLIAQGLQPPHNEQYGHGRFYVAPSPWQHLAQSAKIGAGVYQSSKNDEASQSLADRYTKAQNEGSQAVIDAMMKANTPTTTPGAPEVVPPVPDMAPVGPNAQLSQTRPPMQMPPTLGGGNSPFGPNFQQGAPGLQPNESLPQVTATPTERPDLLEMAAPIQAPTPAVAPTSTPKTPEERLRLLEGMMGDPRLAHNAQAQAMLQQAIARGQADLTHERTMEFQKGEHKRISDREASQFAITQQDKRDENIRRHEDKSAEQEAKIARDERNANNDKLSIEQRRDAANQAAQGKKDHDETLKAIAGLRADSPKLKPGEVMKADGTVVARKGSDLYIKQSGLHSKDYNLLLSIDTKTDQAIKKITDITDPKNATAFANNFGGYNAFVTERFPGATQDIRTKIESIKSDLKSAGLDMIRAGGSIGMMTEREWPIVEKMIAALDPRMSVEEARDAFNKITAYLTRIKNNAHTTYDTEWGETQYYKGKKGEATKDTPTTPPSLGAAPTIEERLKNYKKATKDNG